MEVKEWFDHIPRNTSPSTEVVLERLTSESALALDFRATSGFRGALQRARPLYMGCTDHDDFLYTTPVYELEDDDVDQCFSGAFFPRYGDRAVRHVAGLHAYFFLYDY
ncbi:MAG: hypothetical protein AAGE52_42105 [Myxococcota bacterium]